MVKKLGIVLIVLMAVALVFGFSMQAGAADAKYKVEGDTSKSAPYVIGGGVEAPSRTGCDIFEGFEAGVMPPDGWELIPTHTGDETWFINDWEPHSGTYSADCFYDPVLIPQDEVLISPECNNPQSLTFWSYGSLYWGGGMPFDNYDVEVWLVKGDWDGGTKPGDDIYLGKADDDWAATWEWSESTFDLSSYTGTYRIAFRYIGEDGAAAALDDICIVCEEGPPPECEEEVCETGLDILPGVGYTDTHVNMEVDVNNAPNNVSSFGFDVTYDPTILEYVYSTPHCQGQNGSKIR